MTYEVFVFEFAPLIQIYGEQNYPPVVLERMHLKLRDLPLSQLRETRNLLLDTAKFAPKIPDVADAANIVRARHREGVRGGAVTDDGPRTDEVARRSLATITNILSRVGMKEST
jgi:FMN phosphatase YigB (HAD superfamily)